MMLHHYTLQATLSKLLMSYVLVDLYVFLREVRERDVVRWVYSIYYW